MCSRIKVRVDRVLVDWVELKGGGASTANDLELDLDQLASIWSRIRLIVSELLSGRAGTVPGVIERFPLKSSSKLGIQK